MVTGFAFTGCLREAGIRSRWTAGGRCLDNIFIERLWRSLKYEAVYLRELADGFEARRIIGEWIDFYNTERPHSALGLCPVNRIHSETRLIADGCFTQFQYLSLIEKCRKQPTIG